MGHVQGVLAAELRTQNSGSFFRYHSPFILLFPFPFPLKIERVVFHSKPTKTTTAGASLIAVAFS